MKAPKTSVEKFSNFIHQLTVLETKLAFHRQPCLVIKAGSYPVGINFANKVWWYLQMRPVLRHCTVITNVNGFGTQQ